MKDYYKILGVPKDASPEDLKKAFKEGAKRWHPDRNPGDKAAEERFKDLNEAYAVLSDPAKRRDYDSFGSAGFQQRYSREDIFRNYDLGDLSSLFEGLGLGTDPFAQFFGGGFGFGQQPRQRRSGPQRGQDSEARLALTLEELLAGAQKRLSLQGQGEISLRIPAGSAPGTRLRLAGKGGPGLRGGAAGDLYLVLEALPHPDYRLDGPDLTLTLPIPFSTLALGGTVTVRLLGGEERNLKVPQGSASGCKLRIKGHGLGRNGERGDLFVQLQAQVPGNPTEAQRAALEELKKTGL